jgi:hypothetical protein
MFGRRRTGWAPQSQPPPLPTAVVRGAQGTLSADGKTTMFRVPIPDNVEPGQYFQVYAGNRIVRVKCPPSSAAGQFLQITVPVDPTGSNNNLTPANE